MPTANSKNRPGGEAPCGGKCLIFCFVIIFIFFFTLFCLFVDFVVVRNDDSAFSA